MMPSRPSLLIRKTELSFGTLYLPLDNIRYNKYIEVMARKLQTEIKQKAPFSSIEEEVYLNLLRTGDALSQKVERVLRASGLSGTQYNVLRILRGAGSAGLTCGETGERMVTRDPDITRLLDRLEKRKLITRARDTRDRRVVKARITREGLRVLDTLDKPLTDLQHDLFAHVPPKDLRKLSSLLEQVRLPEG
jgi:DNA-binding MarR family transcriptional regulator